jgi:hypothetical protein
MEYIHGSVSKLTAYGLDYWGLMPNRGNTEAHPASHPIGIGNMGGRGVFPWSYSGQTARLHMALRLRMCEALLPCSHIFSWYVT